LPDSEALSRHLVADTLGAALTRAATGAKAEVLLEFLRRRTQRIEDSLVRLRSAIGHVRQLVAKAPSWVKDAGVHEIVNDAKGTFSWFEQTVPGFATGRIPEFARNSLLSPSVVEELLGFVSCNMGARVIAQLERRS
jgi:hypothetical protein